MLLADIHVPPAWAALAERAAAGRTPVLVLGAVDTGKSTCARHLLGRLIARHGAAALLDGDVGMSMVGTPGLIGLTLVRDVDQLDRRERPDRAWFVGSTTPVGHLLPDVLGHTRLMALVRAERLPAVVNTTGWVQGGAAKELHLAVADVVEPALVAALVRGSELDHLLVPLERRGLEVVRLEPSPRARSKPRAERMQRRSERFARYFETAAPRLVRLDGLALEGTLLGSGRPLGEAERARIGRVLYAHVIEGEDAGTGFATVLDSAPEEPAPEALAQALGGRAVHYLEAFQTTGLLLGLLAGDGDWLGFGLLESWNGDGSIRVRTPLADAEMAMVRRLRLGSLRLSWTGDEQGFACRERELSPAEP